MTSGDGKDARIARLLIESVSGTVEVTAHRLASKVGHGWFTELVQAGHLGAGEAARTYDRRRGTAFEGYAWPRIAGAMIDMLRKAGTRLSPEAKRGLEGAAAALEAAGDFVAEVHDKSPDDVEGEMDGAASVVFVARLCLGDRRHDPEAALLEEERRAHVTQAVDHLPERENTIVKLRFYEGHTFKRIGEMLGVDPQTIQKRYRTAMKRLGATLRPLLLGSVRQRR